MKTKLAQHKAASEKASVALYEESSFYNGWVSAPLEKAFSHSDYATSQH